MAKNELCNECGQDLIDGQCANDQCRQFNTSNSTPSPYGSLDPTEMVSLDPSAIVDYTGTIGVAPEEFGSAIAEDFPASLGADDGAQTRMVDDDFYQQIQAFFPADSGSKSASSDSAAMPKRDPAADFSRSISMRSDRSNLSIEEFVPPVREIRFPSDTATLDQIRELDPATIEGDEYHINEKLGEGGYGIVFEANQTALNRPVAIKVLKPKRKKGTQSKGPSHSGTGTGELQRRRDQFLHEAKITARLQHPNIVPLYDFGINPTGQLFYSMKKVQRRPWSDILHKPERLLNIAPGEVDELAERQAISRNIEIFSRVCDGMAYAHSMKVVHRDLKPDNIMIGDYGEVLLIDFGMALDLAGDSREFSAGGTLVYMAPEMANHFSKQKEIQIAAQKTAQKLGVEKGSLFLDQSNVVGVGSLAKRLIQESKDKGLVELAETLIRLDVEEKELARQISFTSDIYLLGAMLYQIAAGHPPHYFPLSACKKGAREKFQKELWLALKNGFQQYSTITDPLRLSLRAIAIQAMRTDPKDRFQTVEELKEAIRGFQRQVQSLELTESGKESLDKAKGREDYQFLLPALESFRGADELWPDGVEAKKFRQVTACEYATRAKQRRDYDAGLSILDEYVLEEQQQDEPVVEVRKKLVQGKRRTERNRKLAVVGWVAAILLPLAAGIWAYPKVQEAQVAKAETAIAQKKTEEAEMARVAAVGETKKAEMARVAAAEETKKAEMARVAAEEKTKKAEMARVAAEEKTIAAEKATITAEKATASALAKTKDAEAAKTAAEMAADAAEKIKATAVLAKQEAEKAAEKSKKLAAQFQFDADFGEYNSNILTIPLDFRTNKIDEAKSKLQNLRNSDAKPSFKNGWLVKHFAKRLGAGKSIQLGDNAVVSDLARIPGSGEAYAVGSDGNKPAIWKVALDGSFKSFPVELPISGIIADASISSDGKWLGLAIDSTEANDSTATAMLIDVSSGKTIQLPAENAKKLAGCREIEFSDGDNNQFAVIEEIKGFDDTKQRVHIVTYQISGPALKELTRAKIEATRRDVSRVEKFLATIRWQEGQMAAAVAFDSLSETGAEVQKLQVVNGSEKSKAVEIDRFPTALLVGQNNKIYCGHTDGSVDYFNARNLQQGPTSVGENRNESKITALAQSKSGQLISASENGKVAVRNADASFRETFGHKRQLSSIAILKSDPKKGLSFISSDLDGGISFQQPGFDANAWEVKKSSATSVTCGTIDQNLASSKLAATAYGTEAGEVFYYASDAMRKQIPGMKVGEGDLEVGATFGFKSPFQTFDTAFDDFDSMGIVDDYFIVMKQNGTLVTTLIDATPERKRFASSKMKSFLPSKKADRDYVPLMGSVHDQDYFYTNSPTDREALLLWRRSGARFEESSVSIAGGANGEIKRMAMSSDGQWLAVVRLANRKSGEYRVEVFDVNGGSGNLASTKRSGPFRVGDPAFVGFSDDSSKLIFHRHKLGIDRETYVETWSLAGSQWTVTGRPQKVASQKVDLIDWSDHENPEQLVTRLNRKFFLSGVGSDSQQKPFPREEDRTRGVFSTGNANQYYVLATRSLTRYNGVKPNGKRVESKSKGDIPSNARGMRVFGDRVVVLDQQGFHLFNSELEYVTKLADRRSSVTAVSLSGKKLAILYDNQLCRIWNVGGEKPTGIGRVDSVKRAELSPDGRWAACHVGDEIQIFNVGDVFGAPERKIPLATGTFQWSGKETSSLILAVSKADATTWTEIDPSNGKETARKDLPANLRGVTDFKLAPKTENFVAVTDQDGISLWATGDEPVRMNKEDHEFDSASLKEVRAISFSEIKQPNANEIGTRMALLVGKGNQSSAVPRIYLLARQKKNAIEGAKDVLQKEDFRVVEIEGALQSGENAALKLGGLEFSGDGKSLLEVHHQGLRTLLSE